MGEVSERIHGTCQYRQVRFLSHTLNWRNNQRQHNMNVTHVSHVVTYHNMVPVALHTAITSIAYWIATTCQKSRVCSIECLLPMDGRGRPSMERVIPFVSNKKAYFVQWIHSYRVENVLSWSSIIHCCHVGVARFPIVRSSNGTDSTRTRVDRVRPIIEKRVSDTHMDLKQRATTSLQGQTCVRGVLQYSRGNVSKMIFQNCIWIKNKCTSLIILSERLVDTVVRTVCDLLPGVSIKTEESRESGI